MEASLAPPRAWQLFPSWLRRSASASRRASPRGFAFTKLSLAYPPLARAARVQGDVVLNAIIDVNGQITNLQLVSGHPMRVPAAIDAVKQWRYKPYLLNGQPVEVETTITVIFSLSS